MKLLLVFFLSVTLLLSLTEFEKAYSIYELDDFETSFTMFKSLAEDEGDLDAAYILAYMHEHGQGCKVDKVKAAFWYKISSQGYYNRGKDDTTRDIDKEKRKLYKSIQKSDDSDTQSTIRQYAQSLYNLKAHNANYFLPISYRTNGKYSQTNGHEALSVETEFQFSIKYDFAANILNMNEIYSVAYTQLSYWQLYATSAYFRETNYNPEFFITFPVSELYNSRLVKAIQLSFAHQSNGRGGAEERSWNYISATTYMQYRFLFAEFKLWLPVDSLHYNEDLMDYLGYGYLRFILPYKKHIAKLLLRSSFRGESAVELNYSYPLFNRKDLFFYFKGFSGYGESLIDYNNHVDKIGFGFSISR